MKEEITEDIFDILDARKVEGWTDKTIHEAIKELADAWGEIQFQQKPKFIFGQPDSEDIL